MTIKANIWIYVYVLYVHMYLHMPLGLTLLFKQIDVLSGKTAYSQD